MLRQGLFLLLGAYGLLLVGCASFQRKLLYFPSHRSDLQDWQDWEHGVSRPGSDPQAVWLLIHGNAGQAASRRYALPCFPDGDPVFILEYPGYGQRPGKPSRESFNAAAEAAYRDLRSRFPDLPLGVVGESIGSGPACHLATLPHPPDKILLATPFDRLADVAAHHLPILPVRWFLQDRWDNVESLSNYQGPLEIWAAENDRTIPPKHAETLAASRPQTVLHRLPGGHNEWARLALFRMNGAN